MNRIFRLSFLRYLLLSLLPMKQEKISFTEGNILKALIALAIPIIGANLLQTGYQLVDAYWVGRLGANAVAAVSVSYPVNFLLISLTSGFAFAGTILVAQYYGAKDLKMVNHVATQSLVMVFLMSLVLSAVAYTLSPQILQWLGVEQEIFAEADLFQRTIFIGLVFNFGFILFQSLLRGVGEVKIPLYINALSLGLNFLLDPLFIYGWGPIPAYGVAGAAYSTLATLGLSAAIGYYVLFSGKTDFKLTLTSFSFDFPLLKKAFRLGMPSSLEISARAFGLTILTGVAAKFGTEVLAAYGIGARLISFVVIVALGLMKANATLVGQNIGAQKIDRAETTSNYAAGIAFLSMSALGVLFYVFAEPIVRTFLDANDDVVNMGVSFVKITAPSFGFMGMQLALVGTLRGSGNTVESMIFTIIGIWVIQFPFAIIASNMESMGYLGIWWSFPVSYVLPAIITFIWYKTGIWKRKQIIQ
ncbi:MATE family efflux transporter [Roseivirga sp.]|uniref:MATE family efflux transporter n=1 Tax=Roseivirga sp. TaxID=1964215 RepID=UPI003B8D9217